MSAPRAASRDRILEAAASLIATDGFDHVRIARIAQSAGVSTASVHYHFATREELLAEAVAYCFETVLGVRGGAGQTDGGAAARLRHLIERSLPVPGERSREWVLWIELWLRAVREPAQRAALTTIYARWQAGMVEAIEAGVASGEFDPCDAEAVAKRLLATIDGFGLRALGDDPGVTIDLAREETLRLAERELGAAL